MSILTQIKKALSSDDVKPAVDSDNPNFITQASQVKRMLNLMVESRVQVSVIFDDKSEYTSRILSVTNSDIILDQFNTREAHNKVLPSMALQVHAKYKAVPFNFTVTTKTAQANGYCCSFPDKIYHPQKRSFFRISLDNFEKYKFTGAVQYSENTLTGFILDISYGGLSLAIHSSIYIKKGDLLSPCRLELKNGHLIQLDLIACSVKSIPQNGYTRVGCEFLNLSPKENKNIRTFITEYQRQNAKQ